METPYASGISCHGESLSLTGKTRAARKKKLILQTDAIEDAFYLSGFDHFFKNLFSVRRCRMFLNQLSSKVEK